MRPFFKAKPQGANFALAAGGGGMEHDEDGAERIGKAVSILFLIALTALFAFGYLRPLVAR